MCTTCDAGRYSTSNATACSTCERGSSSSPGSLQCTPCAKGKYGPSAGLILTLILILPLTLTPRSLSRDLPITLPCRPGQVRGMCCRPVQPHQGQLCVRGAISRIPHPASHIPHPISHIPHPASRIPNYVNIGESQDPGACLTVHTC